MESTETKPNRNQKSRPPSTEPCQKMSRLSGSISQQNALTRPSSDGTVQRDRTYFSGARGEGGFQPGRTHGHGVLFVGHQFALGCIKFKLNWEKTRNAMLIPQKAKD